MPSLIDLHAHPSLKMHYIPWIKANFHARAQAASFWDPLSFYTAYRHLKGSPMKVMLCAHYVIESGFIAHGPQKLFRALDKLRPVNAVTQWLVKADPWTTVNGMMDTLEQAASASNAKVGPDGLTFRMVYSPAGLETLANNEIALVHAIEGAHCLGYGVEPGQDPEEFWARTMDRLKELKRRGVCLITPSHFWDQPFMPQTEGTELLSKRRHGRVVTVRDDLFVRMKRGTWRWGAPGTFSERFTLALFDLGMLIDLAHTQEHARTQVYELAKDRKRPVVASHMGLQRFFNHEYNLSDEELKAIAAVDGIVGIIPTRRWLTPPEQRIKDHRIGLDEMAAHLKHMADVTGDYRILGIGTDFDGLTNPLKDLYLPRQLDDLAQRLTKTFTDQQINAIFWDNALRVLKAGWRP